MDAAAWQARSSIVGVPLAGLTSIGFLGKKGEKGGASYRNLLR